MKRGAWVVLAVGWPMLAGAEVSFTAQVLPILKERCGECHAPGGKGQEKAGVDLSGYRALMAGTPLGALVLPGSAAASALIAAMDATRGGERMPYHKEPLPEEEIRLIRQWVDEGAQER